MGYKQPYQHVNKDGASAIMALGAIAGKLLAKAAAKKLAAKLAAKTAGKLASKGIAKASAKGITKKMGKEGVKKIAKTAQQQMLQQTGGKKNLARVAKRSAKKTAKTALKESGNVTKMNTKEALGSLKQKAANFKANPEAGVDRAANKAESLTKGKFGDASELKEKAGDFVKGKAKAAAGGLVAKAASGQEGGGVDTGSYQVQEPAPEANNQTNEDSNSYTNPGASYFNKAHGPKMVSKYDNVGASMNGNGKSKGTVTNTSDGQGNTVSRSPYKISSMSEDNLRPKKTGIRGFVDSYSAPLQVSGIQVDAGNVLRGGIQAFNFAKTKGKDYVKKRKAFKEFKKNRNKGASMYQENMGAKMNKIAKNLND